MLTVFFEQNCQFYSSVHDTLMLGRITNGHNWREAKRFSSGRLIKCHNWWEAVKNNVVAIRL